MTLSQKNRHMKQLTNQNSPLLKTVNDFMFLLKSFMLLMFIGYCFSGLTLIQPDEVGLILRMGRLVGETRVDQINEPGWVLALPKPFDEVIRVPVKQIREVRIRELAPRPSDSDVPAYAIDPVYEGYCITADENILQVSMLIKYQITDPVYAVFNHFYPSISWQRLINDLTVGEMVRVAAQFNIDGILSENQEQISLIVRDRVQKMLNELNSGLTIVALEFEELTPPVALKQAFEEVNSAFINRRNYINNSRSLREEKLPWARAQAREMVNNAETYRQETLAQAQADANQFTELLQAYYKNPQEVSLDMLHQTRQKVFSQAGNVLVVPDEKSSDAGIRSFIDISGMGADGPVALPFTRDILYQED